MYCSCLYICGILVNGREAGHCIVLSVLDLDLDPLLDQPKPLHVTVARSQKLSFSQAQVASTAADTYSIASRGTNKLQVCQLHRQLFYRLNTG